MSERWLPVVGLEGVYEVSDRGSVRSLSRQLWSMSRSGKKYQRRLRGRLLKPGQSGGYLRVSLWFRHEERQASVHELVLEAFSGTRPAGNFGCHRDGNRSNNAISNLYWGTQVENMADAKRHGTLRAGERVSWAKLTRDDVSLIRAAAGFVSQENLAAHFGVRQPQISRIVNRKEWKDAA